MSSTIRLNMHRFNIVLMPLFVLFSMPASARNWSFNKRYVSPEISLGYTFHAGLNMGFGLDFGLYDEQNSVMRIGGSLAYNLIKVRDRWHRQASIQGMFQTSRIDLKIGIARMKNPWGYANVNKCRIWGFAGDVSFSSPDIRGPKIGYRNFIYQRARWNWFRYYYHSVYVGYEYFDK